MALPFFYIPDITTEFVVLNEDTSKHIVQVLRMENGEALQLTNGKGHLFKAIITDNNRKRCAVQIIEKSFQETPAFSTTIAISPVKNNSRLEWFLEKATEIGVREIVPLICTRTEKQQFKHDRMNSILISAMLQSQQCWLPVLHEPVKFPHFIEQQPTDTIRLIAHCEEGAGKKSVLDFTQTQQNKLILIGPEGDFSAEEIESALQQQFIPVTLGETRLRTETAGIVAATLLCIH